jgi:hypothetical protein
MIISCDCTALLEVSVSDFGSDGMIRFTYTGNLRPKTSLIFDLSDFGRAELLADMTIYATKKTRDAKSLYSI